MPNWCQNYLSVDAVDGNPETIAAFLNKARGKTSDYTWGGSPKDRLIIEFNEAHPQSENDKERPLCFHKFVPIPDSVLKAGFNREGYNWCIENWGTKWNLDDATEITENGADSIQINFDTAWSPAEGVIKAMIEQHPELNFDLDFEETGNGFRGSIVGSCGKVTTNIEQYDEDFCDECGENLEYSECTCDVES